MNKMKLIFDIGFNVGEFTETCFKTYNDCNVVAVEANPNLCNLEIMRFFSSNNFVLLNNLVSENEDQEIDFYISHNATGVSTASMEFMRNSRFTKGSKNLQKNSINWAKPIKVKSITIDSMIEEYGMPDLIKIDVEGYELNVIKGLTKRANDICFEWHEEEYENLNKILDHLQSLGYEEFGIIGWFDEGDIFEKATFSDKGDPYLEYPKFFYGRNELELEKLINPERRINYGMFFVK
jgi:FkbM family methyltransferase